MRRRLKKGREERIGKGKFEGEIRVKEKERNGWMRKKKGGAVWRRENLVGNGKESYREKNRMNEREGKDGKGQKE